MSKILKPTVSLVAALDENENVLDTLTLRMTGGHALSKKQTKMYLKGYIHLSGADVGMPEVLVKTKGASFKKLCDDITKEDAKRTFKQIWLSIKAVDVDKAFAEQGEEWQNLCDDIALFYACRLRLFDMPAPIMNLGQHFA